MKKFSKISSLLMLLISFMSASANAQNRFFLNPIDLEPGTTGTLELMLDNPDSPFYGFSVDVTLPKGLELVKKGDGKADVSLNADRLGETYQLITNINKDGKLLMGSFSSHPQSPIKGTSGAVAYIKVNVASDFKESTLTLSNIKLINASDRDVPMLTQTSKIGVLPTAIALDQRGIGLEVKDGVSEEAKLSVIFTPTYTTNKTYTWSSSDENVATVSADGVVTAVYKGVATITATTINGKKATCYVSVGIPVTSVDMEPLTASIEVRDRLTITATPLPLDADNREFVQWYSSDETVATVDDKGNVTPIKVGEVTITAQCGSATGTCTVTVAPTFAESVTLSPESPRLMVGESVTLTATVLPDDTTDKTVSWSSSDESIATVDAEGKVTALALGEVTIIASCGDVSGSCTVTVIPTPAQSVTLNPSTAELKVGENIELSYEVLPDDTTDKTVIWTSRNETVATVDANGIVTALAVGEAAITATCGEVSAVCLVSVVPILADSVSLNTDDVTLQVGETFTLVETVLPDDTTDKRVTWTSEDESIIIVDSNGNITAMALGETSVTATCGEASATCKVTVVPTPVIGVSLSNTTLLLEVGNVSELLPIIQPANATDPSVTWHSADEAIATVDANGIVSAIAPGVVIVTVTSNSNPDATAECEVTVTRRVIAVTNIVLNESSIEMMEDDTFKLEAVVTPDDADDRTVTWETSDNTIATVDANGVVTAIKAGTAVIYASTSNGLTADCQVTVKARVIVPTTLTLTNTELLMREGHQSELTPIVGPDEANDKTVTWSSSNETIATVDANGIVTAHKTGFAIITASTHNGITATCNVTVIPDITAVSSISLNKKTLELTEGENFTLIATISPDDATDKSVTWASSAVTFATVSNTGEVTAVKAGEALILASSSNGLTDTCIVKVNPRIIEVTGISIPSTLVIKEGQNADLNAIITPADATDQTVTWSIDDTSIATIDADGLVNALKPGEAIITAIAANGVSATCALTVIPNVISVTGISLNKKELEMTVNDKYTLIATITPDDATDKSVTWKSSDRAIATVSETGEVTATGAGETMVFASSSNGLTDTCIVKVNPLIIEVTGISIPSTLVIKEGQNADLNAIITPADATDQTVTWSIDDTSIATIDADGLVNALKPGEAIITATAANGVSATCALTVIPNVISVTGISLNKKELEMTVNDKYTLIATITPDDATDKSVTWKSADRAIATVSETGEVTATGAGETMVFASSSNGLTDTCIVKVNPAFIEVTGITLSNSELLMKVGRTTNLVALIDPADASDQRVTWRSEDESIATVDADGNVTSLRVGTTNVIVTSVSNPAVSAKCKVIIDEDIIAVTNISLNKESLELIVDDKFTLIATITPDNATDKSVTWESTNTSVATVSANGEVTAISVGETTILASSSNGRTATCVVTVKPGTIPVTGVSLSNTELLLKEGQTAELIAIVRPSDATDQNVIWKTDDETIATVDANGIVTAVKQGVTKITATSANGVSAVCIVTVIPYVITDITLSETERELTVGDNFSLIATITPDDIEDKTVTWESSNLAIATVSDNGEVTAVSVGEVTIFATTVNGLMAKCVVTVKPGIVEVTSISLSNTELLLKEGQTAELIAIVRPSDATDQNVIWTTDDETIATVDANGIVTAVKQGVTKITATSANGVSAVCIVTVIPYVITDITLSETERELTVGDNFTLIATITPDDIEDKTVIWESSNPAIATVSDNGEVTAVSVGEATIFATTVNGLMAKCVVTVIPGIVDVTGITLSNTELLMREGHTAELSALVYPFNATDRSVTWSTDRDYVATVDANGIVTAVKQGLATITATTANGLTAVCVVTVVPEIVAVSGISLNETELEMTEGDTYTLIATITPDDATDKTVTWQSSNVAVATVSDNGVVTAVSAGVATIYASSSNGLTDKCEVTVKPLVIEVSSISLDKTDLTLWQAETATLTALILPDDATDKSVIWTSNNPDIATVDEGVVKGLKPGTATITAKSANGKIAFCAVTVKERPLTPRQLLRKGDGTTCTFVIMMDLSDAELAALGYRYVVGYTDPSGKSSIIAQTSLRYCHTSSAIYNNRDYDFWTFAFVETENGEIVTSNLRHLDGREETCLDPSIYGFDPKGRGTSSDGDNWLTITPSRLSISINNQGETHVGVYTTSGVMIYSKSYSENAPLTDEIELNRFVPGSYVVTLTCGGETKAKKIFVR